MIYLIRVGQFGQLGRFRSEFEFELGYRQKVICRTPRGLEVGEYVERDGVPVSPVKTQPETDGELVRVMTPQDVLLEQRLDKNRLTAVEKCQEMLAEKKIPVVILDAEQTFDGRNLYFYFAGEVTPEVDRVTRQMAEIYDANVKFSEFAETLASGCGPDCGTASSSGCGSGGCSSCGLKAACKK
ncbi:MAG: PSP1 C-terminal domain-containing protein [Planctomycetota bacterium]|nr:PSP1 C-terminal domain-containing protein [Planctomycetota bacterium]